MRNVQRRGRSPSCVLAIGFSSSALIAYLVPTKVTREHHKGGAPSWVARGVGGGDITNTTITNPPPLPTPRATQLGAPPRVGIRATLEGARYAISAEDAKANNKSNNKKANKCNMDNPKNAPWTTPFGTTSKSNEGLTV